MQLITIQSVGKRSFYLYIVKLNIIIVNAKFFLLLLLFTVLGPLSLIIAKGSQTEI